MSAVDDDDGGVSAGDMDELLGQLNAANLADAAARAPAAAGAPQQPPQQQQQQQRQMNPEEFKHYICLYPCYVNPKLTVAKGRRLPLHLLAGCDDPWPHDLAEACGMLGFKRMVMEGGKRHPCDQWPSNVPMIGRIRVELKDKEGNFVVPSITSKEQLLAKMAPLIPGLPGRRMRIEQYARQREMALAQLRAQQAAQAPAKAKKEEKASSSAKKKGKK